MNYIYDTRLLCKSLHNMIELPISITQDFIRLISKTIVHKVAEEATDKEDGKLKETTLFIPDICTIKIKIENNIIKPISVDFDDRFSSMIIKAINNGESPLIKDAESKLVDSLKRRYNSVL